MRYTISADCLQGAVRWHYQRSGTSPGYRVNVMPPLWVPHALHAAPTQKTGRTAHLRSHAQLGAGTPYKVPVCKVARRWWCTTQALSFPWILNQCSFEKLLLEVCRTFCRVKNAVKGGAAAGLVKGSPLHGVGAMSAARHMPCSTAGRSQVSYG